MSTVEIADRGQYFTQLTGNGCFSCSGITRQDNMHGHFLLFAQSAFSTLHTILNRVCHLPDGTLHLVHTNEGVEILKDFIYSPFLRHISLDILLLNKPGICTATDELGKNILSRFVGQMAVTEGLILYFHLILEVSGQLAICLRSEVCNTILHSQVQLTDLRQLLVAWSGHAESILETVCNGGVAF